MLDLKALVGRLIEEEQHSSIDETAKDQGVIGAVNGRDRPMEDRISATVEWLHYYKVLMGYKQDERRAVVIAVLGFADRRSKAQLERDEEVILREFDTLSEQIEGKAPRTKDGRPRQVVSLASKALWCCYPDDVPIFDRNAESALRFISHACKIEPHRSDHDYAKFLSVWFQVFREVEPLITPDCLKDCPSRVRVLDRILWCLGADSYYSRDAHKELAGAVGAVGGEARLS